MERKERCCCGRVVPISEFNLIKEDGTEVSGKRFNHCKECQKELFKSEKWKLVKRKVNADMERLKKSK